jgi:hypothetical protein
LELQNPQLPWCGQGGIRTPEGVRHLIYSQTPLATWVPVHFRTSRKPTTGIEPITYRLQGGCSAVELRRRVLMLKSPARRRARVYQAQPSVDSGRWRKASLSALRRRVNAFAAIHDYLSGNEPKSEPDEAWNNDQIVQLADNGDHIRQQVNGRNEISDGRAEQDTAKPWSIRVNKYSSVKGNFGGDPFANRSQAIQLRKPAGLPGHVKRDRASHGSV